MRRRVPRIPQRRPIFLGCEGQSEAGYGALLGRLARDLHLHVHIHVEPLQPGAGDPLALIERAVQRITHFERSRASLAVKAVLLDLGAPQKNAAATQLAQRHGITHLIWQEPDFEGFLLRHLPNAETLRPPAGASRAALQQRWPDYEKGMAAPRLAQRVGIDDVRRASTVEPLLAAFLREVGLL